MKIIADLDTEVFIYRMISRCSHNICALLINCRDSIIMINILLQKGLSKDGFRKHLSIESLISVSSDLT